MAAGIDKIGLGIWKLMFREIGIGVDCGARQWSSLWLWLWFHVGEGQDNSLERMRLLTCLLPLFSSFQTSLISEQTLSLFVFFIAPKFSPYLYKYFEDVGLAGFWSWTFNHVIQHQVVKYIRLPYTVVGWMVGYVTVYYMS